MRRLSQAGPVSEPADHDRLRDILDLIENQIVAKYEFVNSDP